MPGKCDAVAKDQQFELVHAAGAQRGIVLHDVAHDQQPVRCRQQLADPDLVARQGAGCDVSVDLVGRQAPLPGAWSMRIIGLEYCFAGGA